MNEDIKKAQEAAKFVIANRNPFIVQKKKNIGLSFVLRNGKSITDNFLADKIVISQKPENMELIFKLPDTETYQTFIILLWKIYSMDRFDLWTDTLLFNNQTRRDFFAQNKMYPSLNRVEFQKGTYQILKLKILQEVWLSPQQYWVNPDIFGLPDHSAS